MRTERCRRFTHARDEFVFVCLKLSGAMP
jgi:hypothetical protein